jgi:hypothetical protein
MKVASGLKRLMKKALSKTKEKIKKRSGKGKNCKKKERGDSFLDID